ncbi:hypothetical protein [Burkholderia contaminans]|nr:hypothetical protein [Burkholderia contaminans]MEB4630054.1 hypothetical protein [Burkholderia contaminans]MEB4636238.1 hypothetical protein [Burkholderia contaminans]MEB4650541.1 hypothetical protein [Burkholderia contaminans]MEB4660287.1 hypothetical protein [Burkholderia contaminans]MEB4665820.1 hypothetical protein [Burkholderia contaminans]
MNATVHGGAPGPGRVTPYAHGAHGDKGRSDAIGGVACIDVD